MRKEFLSGTYSALKWVMKKRIFPFATAAAALLSPAVAAAAPYASGVTVTGDAVTFILNESADTVKVVFNEGATTIVIGTTPEPAGMKTFSKAGFTSFRIEVEKNAGPGWKSGVLQQISQDTNDLVKFANGRGVAVNRLPDTGPLFARLYFRGHHRECRSCGGPADTCANYQRGHLCAECRLQRYGAGLRPAVGRTDL